MALQAGPPPRARASPGGWGPSAICIRLGQGPWPLSLNSSLQGTKERGIIFPQGSVLATLSLTVSLPSLLSSPDPADPLPHVRDTFYNSKSQYVIPPLKTLQTEWLSHKTLLSC